MKIAIMGLDASGKTSFLSTLQKKYSVLWNLKPTKGVERDIFTFLDKNISLWDFGGQAKYRRKYLTESSRDLDDVQLIFYLIDITDPQRMDESLEYLKDILSRFESNLPHLVVSFHKYDPDLRGNPQIQELIHQMKDRISNIIPNALYFNTSIFDEKSLWRSFSQGIRKLSSGDELLFSYLAEVASNTNAQGISILDIGGMSICSYVLDEDADWVIESCAHSFLDVWKSINIRGMNPGIIDFDIAKGTTFFTLLTNLSFKLFVLGYFRNKNDQLSFLDQIPELEAKMNAIIDTFFIA
ncbi:MAG: ADP-ribosylation factor-like protein [Candidatus Hodarchaeota archaeon]